jgi:hypothetical protein
MITVHESRGNSNREALPRLGSAQLVEHKQRVGHNMEAHLTQAPMTRLIGGIPATTLGDLLKDSVSRLGSA